MLTLILATGWCINEDVSILTRVWRGTWACSGDSQFIIALVVIALLETNLVLGFLEWNPYICMLHSKNHREPDFRSPGHPFPSTTCPGFCPFIGIPLHCPSDHHDKKHRDHTIKKISNISLYIFTWVLLVIYTSVLRGQKIGNL